MPSGGSLPTAPWLGVAWTLAPWLGVVWGARVGFSDNKQGTHVRYTFFEIENFKGIKNTRLDLASSGSGVAIYTLVGLNESGKTTVLEAIDHFQATSEGGEVSPKQLAGWVPPDPHELIPIAERSNFNGTVCIRCGIELDEADIAAAQSHLKKDSGYRLESLNASMTITDIYEYENSRYKGRRSAWTGLAGMGRTKQGRVSRAIHSHAEPWQELARFIRTRLPVIWFFPNFLFNFPERIYLEEPADESPSADEGRSARFYRALFQDILDALGRNLTIEDHIVARARSGKRADQNSLRGVLLEAEREVTKTVVSAWGSDSAGKGDLREARRDRLG
jgi:hypothetical protein